LDVAPIKLRLASCRPTGADEANRVFITLRVHDKNKTLLDRSDGDEPILFIGVCIIEDLQVVVSTGEQGARFSNETPCFFRFVRLLDSSQTTLTRQL
jgi:hypothetical protein